MCCTEHMLLRWCSLRLLNHIVQSHYSIQIVTFHKISVVINKFVSLSYAVVTPSKSPTENTEINKPLTLKSHNIIFMSGLRSHIFVLFVITKLLINIFHQESWLMFKEKTHRALVSGQGVSDLLKVLLSNNQINCSAAEPELKYCNTRKSCSVLEACVSYKICWRYYW